MLHLLACWCFLDEKHRQAISSFFVGRIRPSNIRMVVVLPAPLGPRNPKTVPAETVRFKVSTARCGPKCLESPFISIARGVAPFALVICIVYSFVCCFVYCVHPSRMAPTSGEGCDPPPSIFKR